MHLLIAGHGYLGQELHRQASEAGWRVTALSQSGFGKALPCDLSDRQAVCDLADKLDSPSAVALTASSGRGGPKAYRSVFVEGTRHLQQAFPQAHLLFVSSTSVYHQCDGSIVTEASPTNPERETSQILLEAEELSLSAGGTVARLAGIYGPTRSVILKRFLEGRAVIEEDGRRFLNQIHRDDAASAILHLLTQSESSHGEIYNVCDSAPLHQGDCYCALAQIFKKDVPPSGPRPENRKRAWTHKRISNAKLCDTGWTPCFPSFIDAVEGIAPTVST